MNSLLFAYTIALALIFPLFFPFLHLVIFAPFIILMFYRYPLTDALWWSLLSGTIVDLFSSETRLGHYALIYCLSTLFLYRYRFYFFEDRLSTLPLMTISFSCLSMVIQVLIFLVTSRTFSLSWEWLFNDLVLIPLQTAGYAIFAYTLPLIALLNFKRRYFLLRRKL